MKKNKVSLNSLYKYFPIDSITTINHIINNVFIDKYIYEFHAKVILYNIPKKEHKGIFTQKAILHNKYLDLKEKIGFDEYNAQTHKKIKANNRTAYKHPIPSVKDYLKTVSCKGCEFTFQKGRLIYKDKFILESVKIPALTPFLSNQIWGNYEIEINSFSNTFHFVPYTHLSRIVHIAKVLSLCFNYDINYNVGDTILDVLHEITEPLITNYINEKYIIKIPLKVVSIEDDSLQIATKDAQAFVETSYIRNESIPLVNDICKEYDLDTSYYLTKIKEKTQEMLISIVDRFRLQEVIALYTGLSKGNTKFILNMNNEEQYVELRIDTSETEWYYTAPNSWRQQIDERYYQKPRRMYIISDGGIKKIKELSRCPEIVKGDYFLFSKNILTRLKEILTTHYSKWIANEIPAHFYYKPYTILDILIKERKLERALKITKRYYEYHPDIVDFEMELENLGKYEIYAIFEDHMYKSDDEYSKWGAPATISYMIVSDSRIILIPTKSNSSFYNFIIDKNKKQLALCFLIRYFTSPIRNKRQDFPLFDLSMLGIQYFYKENYIYT